MERAARVLADLHRVVVGPARLDREHHLVLEVAHHNLALVAAELPDADAALNDRLQALQRPNHLASESVNVADHEHVEVARLRGRGLHQAREPWPVDELLTADVHVLKDLNHGPALLVTEGTGGANLRLHTLGFVRTLPRVNDRFHAGLPSP